VDRLHRGSAGDEDALLDGSALPAPGKVTTTARLRGETPPAFMTASDGGTGGTPPETATP
jgi:hypothetical protein